MNMAVRDLMQLALPLTVMIFLYRRKSILNGSGDGKQQSSRKVIHSYPRWMKATPKSGEGGLLIHLTLRLHLTPPRLPVGSGQGKK